MLPIFHWLTVFASVISHPFYLSMTEINYNNKSKAIEVSVRIFTDDFEKTLRKNCNCKVDLLNPSDSKSMEKIVGDYIKRRLQIKVNGNVHAIEFLGYQQEQESIWSYFVINNISQVKKIEVSNTLLHDYREEQINMLHIKANGKELTEKLDYPARMYSISF